MRRLSVGSALRGMDARARGALWLTSRTRRGVTDPAVRGWIVSVLKRTAEQLRLLGLPAHVSGHFSKLALSIDEPYVVAVVGQVSAGKSLFANALLETDIAPVGVNET